MPTLQAFNTNLAECNLSKRKCPPQSMSNEGAYRQVTNKWQGTSPEGNIQRSVKTTMKMTWHTEKCVYARFGKLDGQVTAGLQ